MPALDHRGSFDKMLQSLGLNSEKDFIFAKKLIISATYDGASGLLLDPKYGLTAYREFTRDMNDPKPYLLCIEKSGYIEDNFERVTELEFPVSDLKKMGARGIKILLFINPDSKTVQTQIDTAKKVLDDCRKENLPFFLEFLTYELPDIKYNLSESIISSLKLFLQNGVTPDVFKLEYPGDGNSCNEITKLLGSIPWILLTKAGEYDTFKNNLKVAVSNGATGFLAGRSLWKDFVDHPKSEWETFFMTKVKSRFGEISRIVTSG
jgi:tagatose-1,6-bisphosphate aldolase